MSIAHLKLYHFPATRSVRARWALQETVGDGFELETVQLYAGAQYRPDFLAKNPNHSVPLLEITLSDGQVHRMVESVAMVQWLIDAHPEKALAPRPDLLSVERADYLQMLHFGGTQMDMALWQIRVHEHLLPTEQIDARTAERYRRKFHQEIEPQLLARLEATPFICGQQFSGADIVIGHNVTWALGYGLCQQAAFKQYLGRLKERPAFLQAFDDVKGFSVALPDREKNRYFSG